MMQSDLKLMQRPVFERWRLWNIELFWVEILTLFKIKSQQSVWVRWLIFNWFLEKARLSKYKSCCFFLGVQNYPKVTPVRRLLFWETASQKMSAWEFVSIAGVLASLSGVIIMILGVVEITVHITMTDFRRTRPKTDSFWTTNNKQRIYEQNPNDEISLKELIEKGQEWYNYLLSQWKIIVSWIDRSRFRLTYFY
jgi:hypothetical protein